MRTAAIVITVVAILAAVGLWAGRRLRGWQ